jgi:uncharacterized protein (TIGR03382 family)
MKLATILLFASVIWAASARVAAACQPAPTCGDEFCWGSIAVMEATLVSMPTTENFRTTVLVHVTNAWGMTDGIPVGGNATLATTQGFSDDDIGTSLVLYLERNSDGDLSIERRVDLADSWTTMCFGADVTAETIATIALQTDCYHTLTPVQPENPRCPSGPGCNAGGAASGGPIALLLAGLVIRRRRQKK